jgi:hypothetical protein
VRLSHATYQRVLMRRSPTILIDFFSCNHMALHQRGLSRRI